jgi:hypothetical protein
MPELVLSIVAVGVLVGIFALGRRARSRAHSGSRTTELRFDPDGVTRQMADGRSESVAWADVTWVEVVCTRVPTADGARAFALLGASEEEGCLVPIGVGHDTLLLQYLARLGSFDLRRYHSATDRQAPARTMVWSKNATATS